MADLGTPPGVSSYGNEINHAGQVAGSSATIQDLTTQHAFVWEGGKGFDLNSMVKLALDEYLTGATSINDLSQILAVSNLGKTYVLTPNTLVPISSVPIPGAALLLGSGLTGLAAVGRRRRSKMV